MTCYNRTDDLICRMPPWGKHVGSVVWLEPKQRNTGIDHSIELCMTAMREDGVN